MNKIAPTKYNKRLAYALLAENGVMIGSTLSETQREQLRRHVRKAHDKSCGHCAGVIPRLLDTIDMLESLLAAALTPEGR